MGRFLNPKAVEPAARPQPAPGAAKRRPAFAPPETKAAKVAEPPPETDPLDADIQNPLRNLAFKAGLAFLFVEVAVLHELLASVLHFDTYLLYLVGPPALLGALFTGAIGRTVRHPAAKLWLGMVVCMLLSLPFSSWVGSSLSGFRNYFQFALPFMFIVGGLTLTWAEVRKLFGAFALGGVVIILAARFMATSDGGRVELSAGSGTVGNSNDLASHLVLVLPFLFYIFGDKQRSKVVRFGILGPALYSLYVIFGTASRGALIALAVALLVALLRGSMKQRGAILAMVLALAVAAPFVVTGNAADRLLSLFGGTQHEEAEESKDARSYLLKQSIIYTLQNPVFGIGMGQFANYEGKLAIAEGRVGNWHVTHNALTQVSSECGVPALVFFLLGIGAAMVSVDKTYRRARELGNNEIARACYCYLIAVSGYFVSIIFLANAFRFYLPALIGLAIAIKFAADRELGRMSKPVQASLVAGGFRPQTRQSALPGPGSSLRPAL